MPYVRRGDGQQLDQQFVRMLAQAVNLQVFEEDIEPLTAALSDQLASIALLDRLELMTVNAAHTTIPAGPLDLPFDAGAQPWAIVQDEHSEETHD